MGIEVKGNGNRVAGNDYYELKIKFCPRCEMRGLNQGMNVCNHCRSHEAMLEARTKLVGFFMGVFVVFGWLMQRRIDSGVAMAPGELGGMLVTAVGVVLIAVCVYMLVVEWFKRNW